jgi:hypothetical protein
VAPDCKVGIAGHRPAQSLRLPGHVESKLSWPVQVTHHVAAHSRFVRRRSGVSVGDFLVRLSGPFPGADVPRERAPHGGAVRDGLASCEATAARREASLTVPSTVRA